jgi:uncharacterized protein with HEPN domain
MFDRDLALALLRQIDQAADTIQSRTRDLHGPDDFTDTPAGREKLDGVCMQFMAIGEALKKVDRITESQLLARHPDVDWKGAIGFRDIIAHQYFDIDAEQVFWICTHSLKPMSAAIKRMIASLDETAP